MDKDKSKNTKFLFVVFLLVFIVVYVLAAGFSALKSYNMMTKLTIRNKIASSDVVLIAIDDKSIFEIGRWPWKREYYLELFDFVENYTKARLVGYDGIVVAPDKEHPESDKKFFSQIGNYKKLTAGVAFSYDDFEKGVDSTFYDDLLNTKFDIKIIDKRSNKYKTVSRFDSFSVLQKEYFKNILSLGFVNVPQDHDGYIRRASQLVNYKGNFIPSLALNMYSKYTGIKEFVLTDKYLLGISDKYFLKVPINSTKGFITNYICYYNSPDNVYSHKKYSASDIINSYRMIKKGQKPLINPQEFDNKFIFIGANAQAQALSDIQRTPISENFSGLDIQATNFDNLLRNNFFRNTSHIYNFALSFLIFIVIFALANSVSIPLTLLTSVIVACCYLAFAFFMFYHKIAISVILPEIIILVSLICAYSYKYLIENYKKLKIQNAMRKYLSADVAQNVVQNIDNIELGGKKEDVTILFADIRNFTSISENMDASLTSSILNEYFSAMVPIIERHNGILNKFMGDAILAIFGSPKKSDNHALDAVRCGYNMLKKVKQLREKWIEEGKPEIEIGIGMSSGEAFIGNIGSQNRLEYTVIGDTVNTASRIENYNKVYRTNFLISGQTYERVKEYIDTIEIRDVVIRGKTNKVNLYEVIRLNEDKE